MKLKLSHSSLETFRNCPKRFYHEKVLNDVKRLPPSPEVTYGLTIHEALENHIKTGEPLGELASPYGNWLEMLPIGEKVAEKPIVLSQDGRLLDSWDHPDGYWRAKLDLIILPEDNPNKTIIVDWKTGKPRPKEQQMHIYAKMVSVLYPERTDITALFAWLSHGLVDVYKYSSDDVERNWERIIEEAEYIEECIELEMFPPRQSPLCNWCPVRQCLFNPRHVGKIQ